MASPLAPHIASFGMTDWALNTALTAIPEGAADRRLDATTNPTRNIALHLLVARHGMCAMLGSPQPPLPWSNLGEGTQAGFAAGAPKPKLAEIMAAWNKLTPNFLAALKAASPAALAAPSPMPIPGIDKPTIADFVPLNVVHESYHLGQLGMIAKVVTGRGILNPAG